MSEDNHRYHIAFPISDELRDSAVEVISRIRESEDKSDDIEEFIDVVEQISSHGLRYFFLDPIKMVGLGSVAFRTVEVALNTGQRAVMSVARRLARRMDDEQIVAIAEFVEGLVYDFEIEE